ncbi:alpha/beta fold hydrolase [Paractinoplanes hotanensis]|uniref:Alpha/beta hydrolase n=1 Tax=Paractinoplanes hotanensis TaxID=2906497 RepID=A0ABT0YFP1_9ACTN|nr:alpha/beta hydrolase [Actinoplanes hotanensis]MCM4084332.1 alpha/beta hydrolase [Actinoplanes hotanensis]
MNGIRVAYIDEGSGPLVILLHGWPESSYSWHHQIEAVTANGYRVIAPDLRGFGSSDHPAEADAYTVLHFVGDLVALLADVEADEAVIVGHDWGSVVAWGIAMMRPDLVRGVIGISGPPQIPRGPAGLLTGSQDMFTDGRRFYLEYLRDVGPADAEFDQNPRATLRGAFDVLQYGYEVTEPDERMIVQPGQGLRDTWPDPGRLPDWMSEQYFDLLAASFEEHGFTASLNFYRNLDRTWELTAPFDTVALTVPSLLLLGEKDVVRSMFDYEDFVETLSRNHPGFRGTTIVPGAGHWVPGEQPQAVTDIILTFVKDLS